MPTQSVTLSVWEKSSVLLRAVQGEAKSRTVSAALTDAGRQPVDLTGASVRLYVRKPDNTVVFLDGVVSDPASGVCCFTLSSGVTAAPGIATCQILVSWPDGRSLKVIGLIFEILPSDLDGAVESASEFPALVTALNSTEATASTAMQAVADGRLAVTDAQQAAADFRAAIAATNTADNEASSAADSATTAAQAATNAATAANTAAQSATTAANTATGAAGSATNAAQSCNNALANMAAVAQAAVDTHASRTDNPHHVTAAQIGAAGVSSTVQDLQLMDGLSLGNNQVCKVILTDIDKIVCAELVSTKNLPAGTKLLQLPNVKYGYFPKAIFVSGAFCYAWLYGDGSLKNMQDIPSGTQIVIDLVYV